MKKRTPELEEYLETLARYKEERRDPKVKDLSKDLGVSAASVSQMLRKLSAKGFVEYERYGEIKLTGEGEALGKKVLRKHRLIERFLILIGVKKDKVHDEACLLEHALSDDVEKALRKALADQPDVKHKEIRKLTDLGKGDKATIILITGGKSVCRRLTDMGLTPGTEISIGRASTRVGPVEVCIRNSCLAIGRGLAQKIFVKV